jgi:penicillin-binding protein 2
MPGFGRKAKAVKGSTGRWLAARDDNFSLIGEKLGQSMPPEEQEQARRTLKVLTLVVLAFFGLLFLRLWTLQLVEGEEHRRRSEHNRIRLQDLPPWRGMILDRNGEILVSNRPSFDLVAVLEDIADFHLLAQRLSSRLNLEAQQILEQLAGAQRSGFHQVRLKGDLTWREMALVETYKAELLGVSIMVTPKREYRCQSLGCHILGFLGEISDAQLKSGRYPNYKMGDYMGKRGIELYCEEYLRGRRGYRRIEVDAFGRELRQLDQRPSYPGANVYLTLDLKLQQEAEACLEDREGAVVALDPRSGKIRAMASAPPFSQEAFERGLSASEWQELVSHKYHPLLNRALKGQYPPGSTFKIVMAIAGLEEKVITPSTTVYCSGAMPFGNHVFRCWRRGGHGRMNLHSALVHSCDIYFYHLGRRLGIERIAAWSRRFGLGGVSGLKVDSERPGLVASSAWKKARFGYPWQEGDTVSVSIGQGYNLTTPLQMAQVVAALANGGIFYEPQLVERVESPDGEILYQSQPVEKSRLGADPEHLALVQKSLLDVVNHGTGRNSRLPHLHAAGKTGTSQVVALEKIRGGKKEFQNHAWFVAYAPFDEPQLAVSVLVEHAGGGGAVAAPMAKRLMSVYFPQPQVAKAGE